MDQVVTAKQREIVFWACGGTGIDQARDRLEVMADSPRDIYSKERVVFVDTSDSNMHNLSTQGVFRVPNIDGGGKNREKVKAAFYPVLPQLLLEHPAGDMNVVLFSLAGGTGSAIGPLLMGHLMKAGHNVVGVCISDHTSSASTINGINALSDLESISGMLGKPVVLAHHKNDPEKTDLDNDAYAKMVMSALSILSSGKNMKLDSSDVANFIDYTQLTHHQAGLAELHVKLKADEITPELGTIASFAAVLRGESSPKPKCDFGYDAIGYLPINAKGYETDFYFAVTPGMGNLVNELIAARDHEEKKRKVSVQAPKLNSGLNSGNSFGNSGINLN